MELQEDHQLNCPLRGCAVLGEQNTLVVFPSWCPTKPLQLHNAALSSALLLCSFSGTVEGLLCTKISPFSEEWISTTQQVEASWWSGLGSQRKRHHPLVNSTFPSEPALMDSLLPTLQTAQGVSTLGTWEDHPLKSKYLGRISHRKVEVQPVHSQTIPRSLEVQGDAGCR